jgi:hypothetical protein
MELHHTPKNTGEVVKFIYLHGLSVAPLRLAQFRLIPLRSALHGIGSVLEL